MIKYPRIYSFSTVGIIMHFNQDYLLHPIRTDFTGKNGIGKSLIADLFQILFISDKKKMTLIATRRVCINYEVRTKRTNIFNMEPFS